jgi:hypothetical protein
MPFRGVDRTAVRRVDRNDFDHVIAQRDEARAERDRYLKALENAVVRVHRVEGDRDRYRDLVERAVPVVTQALNCSAHPWYGSDEARRWLLDREALDG